MNNLIGPGSIVSPQNRLAISQSKMKFQQLNQPSGRTSHKDNEIEEAEQILQKYGRLSGQLYSTSTKVRRPLADEPIKLNTDSSKGAFAQQPSHRLLTSVDKVRESDTWKRLNDKESDTASKGPSKPADEVIKTLKDDL